MRALKFKFWNCRFRMMSKSYDLEESHIQYTGLTDKNKIEAYYGDIIRFEDTEGKVHIEQLNYSDELCCLMVGNMPYIQLYQSGFIQPSVLEFEIIGNIHQTPELLK